MVPLNAVPAPGYAPSAPRPRRFQNFRGPRARGTAPPGPVPPPRRALLAPRGASLHGDGTEEETERAAPRPARTQVKKVSPVGERVLVRVGEVEDVSQGGILLPSSAQKKPTAGEITQAAADCKSVKAGDRVVYSKYAGTEVAVGGEEYVLLKEDDCIGLMGGDNVRELKPLGNRVLVKIAEKAKKSSGGVILSSAEMEKPTIGEVIAVGPGKAAGEGEDAPPAPTVKAGDSVLYSKYAGVELEGEDGSYIVVTAADVLAVLA